MFKNKITKLTSGAAIIGVAPTLALQAQGRVDVASEKALEKHFQSKMFKVLGWGIVAIVGVISLVLMVKYLSNKRMLKGGKVTTRDKNEFSSGNNEINVEMRQLLMDSGKPFSVSPQKISSVKSEVLPVEKKVVNEDKSLVDSNTKELQTQSILHDLRARIHNNADNISKLEKIKEMSENGKLVAYIMKEVLSKLREVKNDERYTRFLKDEESLKKDFKEDIGLIDSGLCLLEEISKSNKVPGEKLISELEEIVDKIELKFKLCKITNVRGREANLRECLRLVFWTISNVTELLRNVTENKIRLEKLHEERLKINCELNQIKGEI